MDGRVNVRMIIILFESYSSQFFKWTIVYRYHVMYSRIVFVCDDGVGEDIPKQVDESKNLHHESHERPADNNQEYPEYKACSS